MPRSPKRLVRLASKRTNQVIERLEIYYQLGQQAVQLGSVASGPYAPGVITALMIETGESRATVTKCRKFAELYSDRDLRALCRLRTPSGKPIGWGHVTKLITISNSKLRTTLQARAAREGWTARQLEVQIQKRNPERRRVGGKKPNMPTSKREALLQIATRSQQWLAWYQGFENAETISVADLPDEMQKLLKEAMRAIRKLEMVTKLT